MSKPQSLSRRLFALFLLTTLVPLALSDWVAGTAVDEFVAALSRAERTRATRQAAMQVFDRLMTGKTLLLAASGRPDGLGQAPGTAASAGPGRVFLSVQMRDEHDGPATPRDRSPLWTAWEAAAPREVAARRAGADAERLGQVFHLRTVPAGVAGAPRVLVGTIRRGVPTAVAEFDPGFLWAPLANAGDDSLWTVADADGRLLSRVSGADFGARTEASGLLSTEFRLFLNGEFAAGDWTVVQHSPQPTVLWHGRALQVWLGLVAVVTLLAIAIVARRLIRRTLVPLARLTDGTRRLAEGVHSTRIAVQSRDELGVLAHAFNEMAGRIEAQFNAIQERAAIDRDILAGLSIEELGHRVVRQLAVAYPQARVTFVWLAGDGLRRIALQSGDAREPEPLPWAEPQAPTQPLDRLAGVVEDRTERLQAGAEAPAADEALCSAPPWPSAWRTWLPLRLQEVTQAVLVIDIPATTAAPDLAVARELRDRLAVGLATRARERELMHRAVHDSLTGLLNRVGLRAGLDDMLASAREGERVAVLFLDLDHFKDVNDTLGHQAGDALLCMASERLVALAGKDALIARQGGDEFAIVVRTTDAALPMRIAAQAVEAMGRTFEVAQTGCRVGGSVGVAYHPDDGQDRDELLRCADVALYAAKALGRGRASRFTASMDEHALRRAQLLADLHGAVERSELVLYYQPRVRPHDGRITSAEALLRWQHPKLGLLYPDAFIGAAEDSGLIEPIGRWVIDAACAQMSAWQREGMRLERLSVNVSPRQLAPGDLADHVRAALDRHALAPHALELEVTESLLVGDVQSARRQLAALRAWGVSVALDDFGTGYSSLSVLRDLPIDVMKIDRSFVTQLELGDSAVALIRTIATLASSLALKLVAEGVETPGQARLLASVGCDELQGFLYSRPVPSQQFRELAALPFDAAEVQLAE